MKTKRRRRRKKCATIKPSRVRSILREGVRFIAIRTAIISRDAAGREQLTKPNVAVREVIKQTAQEMRCKVIGGDGEGTTLTFSWYGVTILQRRKSLWLYAKQDCGRKHLVLIVQTFRGDRSGKSKAEESTNTAGLVGAGDAASQC